MMKIKRVEIIIDQVKSNEILNLLELHGFDSFTLIPGASGKGGRGDRRGGDITGVFSNCLILLACDPGRLNELTQLIQPILGNYGGLCMISDADAVTH